MDSDNRNTEASHTWPVMNENISYDDGIAEKKIKNETRSRRGAKEVSQIRRKAVKQKKWKRCSTVPLEDETMGWFAMTVKAVDNLFNF